MGATHLHLDWTADGSLVTVSFSKTGNGAERWRRIVDSFDEAIEWLQRIRGFDVARPDGDVSLGRGARRVLPSRAWPLVRAAWEMEPAVRNALADRSLRIGRANGPTTSPLVSALARRWVADNSLSGSGALSSCFD